MSVAESQRIDFEDLADEPMPAAPVPLVGPLGAKQVHLAQVAPNPFNKRKIRLNHPKTRELADSIEDVGMLQPCPAVSREAFLTAFPKLAAKIGSAELVQVAGARRRAAIELLGRQVLDVVVNDQVVADSVKFLISILDENLEREELDPMEEAEQVNEILLEMGDKTQKMDLAARLKKSPTWVSHVLARLKLDPEVQELLRAGRLSATDVRGLHKKPAGTHMTLMQDKLTGGGGDDDATPTSSGKTLSPEQLRQRRWGATPVETAKRYAQDASDPQLMELIKALQDVLMQRRQPVEPAVANGVGRPDDARGPVAP
jgi:ParB/RepB/Spo0J family partition protein